MKEFNIEVVLTITTGRLLCNIGEVYKILDYMTGESLFTHQIPRASNICREYILRQYPNLPTEKEANEYPINEKNYNDFVKLWQEKYPDPLPIAKLPNNAYESKHPIKEAEEMGFKNIIAVEVAGEN